MKKILLLAMTASITFSNCISINASTVDSEDVTNSIKQNSFDNSKIENILSLKTTDGKELKSFTDSALVHNLYRIKNDGDVERSMFENYSGNFSAEFDYTYETWVIPVIENGIVKGEYLYDSYENKLTVDEYIEVKNNIGFGMVYPPEKLAQIISEENIGTPTDIKSAYITFPSAAIFIYIKTEKGEYLIPTRDVKLSFYNEDDKYTSKTAFSSLKAYKADDFVNAYKSALTDRQRHDKEYSENNNIDSDVSHVDDNGDIITVTAKPSSTPKSKSTPKPTISPTALPTLKPSPAPTILPSISPTISPTNIDCSDWAKKYITEAISIGIVPKPLQDKYILPINREDFCIISYNMLNMTEKISPTANKNTFEDINSVEISALSEANIINGRDEKIFAPQENITREEAATILSRILNYAKVNIPQNNISNYDDDSNISDWAKKHVYIIKTADIMNGMENNNFIPKGTYTKEQAITTLMRLYAYLK